MPVVETIEESRSFPESEEKKWENELRLYLERRNVHDVNKPSKLGKTKQEIA